jgi:formyltetrahydrofolate synthetase
VGFIHCSALAFRCKECLKCNATVPPKITETPESKEQAENMDTVKQTIANLETKVQSFHDEVIAKLNTYSSDISKTVVEQEKPRPPTYAAAAAVSADVLKSIVAETIREQQKATIDGICVMMC